MNWRSRYTAAYHDHQSREYPSATKDFGFVDTKYPCITKANGLTQAVVNFLNWSGHRATRVQVQGQMMIEKYRGHVVNHGFRPTTTRKGTADISATIAGRSVMIEIKADNDKPSGAQILEQARERAAGGQYEFIYNIDQFFEWYDGFVLSLK